MCRGIGDKFLVVSYSGQIVLIVLILSINGAFLVSDKPGN